jgi:hypothetical protein
VLNRSASWTSLVFSRFLLYELVLFIWSTKLVSQLQLMSLTANGAERYLLTFLALEFV